MFSPDYGSGPIALFAARGTNDTETRWWSSETGARRRTL